MMPRSSIDTRDSMQVSGMPGGGPGSMASGQRGSRGGTRGPSVRGIVRNDRGGSGRGSFNEDSGELFIYKWWILNCHNCCLVFSINPVVNYCCYFYKFPIFWIENLLCWRVGGCLCLVKEWILFSTGTVGGDGDRRRMGPSMMQQYPDNQQLFMGNLPHHATEDDLKVNSSS